MIHHLRRQFGVLILALVCLACAGGPLATVAAQSATVVPTAPVPRFSIQPEGHPNGYFSVELAPGASVDLSAVVRTTGDSAPVDLRVYRANALSMVNGGFGAGTEEDALIGESAWIALDPNSFSLGPAESHEVGFSVTVPADTAPGQYVAAIVVQTDGAVPIPGMDTFDQIVRSAIAVEIVVPGERTHGFELGEPEFNLEAAAPRLIIPVSSTGNYLVKPTGELTIATGDGTVVARAPVAMGSIYGGDQTTLEIALPDQMPAGDYVVSGTLTDPGSKAADSLDAVTLSLPERQVADAIFSLDSVSVEANGAPIQFANVAIAVSNNGAAIPTASLVLLVARDGKQIEEYPLARNQALPAGASTVTQRYIPASGWEKGTYTFAVVVTSVDAAKGTETVLATVEAEGSIVVP